ncbi:hypothetical protein FHETE_5631 [Fusarium heterosporum]|uniref:Chromo domain-containing protein n=1 Tax=Fusarium heterosporum TaxID=42747 RepID=A0A8H5TDH4_FUSHE|nr:hypothetical protein FHETE_5631 [Fusarium heterosporum]
MDDSDDESIASTIQTEHGSEEEWIVSDIRAAWEVDGSLRYLIRWEGFDLCEATWEPKENLNDHLIGEWEKTKAQGDFDLFQRIREWKKAWKDKYNEKRERHRRRNRLRKKRGLKPTSFAYMEEHLAWVSRFPDGEELGSPAVSSPLPSVHDHDADIGVGQQSQLLPAKRNLVVASLSEDSSPKPTAQNNTTNIRKNTLSQASLNVTSNSHKQAPQKNLSSVFKPIPAPASSLLSSKLSKPIKRSDQRKSQSIARKSQPAQAFTGNVFASGKERKKRVTLAENAKDPNKAPRLLKPRPARIIEKASRDRECAAPTRVPSDLISLNPAERHTGNPSIQSPGVIIIGTHAWNDGDIHSRRDESPPKDNTTSKAKVKKSISWGNVQEKIISSTEEPTTFERETSLFLRRDSVVPTDTVSHVKNEEHIGKESTPSIANVPSQRVAWTETTPAPTIQRDKNPLSKTIATDIQFGPGTRETISVAFERNQPPSQPEQPWPNLFENEPILIFTHTCIAQDFWYQEKALTIDKLGHGSVVSSGNPTSLSLVANWLGCRSLGVLLYRSDLCVFLHIPPEVGTLQYSLFRPATHFTTRSLAPVILPEDLESGDVLPQMTSTLFNRMLGFQYEQILPENAPMNLSKHSFFLAFPASAGQEAQFIGTWLRSCNPECKIFSTFFPGQWRSFVKLDQGVVIVHEEAIWSIRMFPNVWGLLNTASNFSFRLFSKCLQPEPLYPSLGQPCRIGDVSLLPICGSRKALLVTPSFVVSQPQQCWNFFKWFYKAWHDNHDSIRLVVCASFDSWILDVAAENEDDWALHKSANKVRDDEKEVAKQEHDALYKSWEAIRALMDYPDEEQSALIFAPECIDDNDEQSIVNWFGWWSIMNLDTYRKFSVVGSSETRPERLTRRVKAPSFTTSTLVSLDEAPSLGNSADRSLTTLQKNAIAGPLTSQPRKKFGLISGDDVVSFTNLFHRLENGNHRSAYVPPQSLFSEPVAYWSVDMARDFSDYPNGFATYSSCLEFFLQAVYGPGYHNTGIAFCYTPERTWSPGQSSENIKKGREPWLVAYRAVYPHLKPWRAAELIIWDPAWKAKLRENGDVYEGDLSEAQRRMIQAVREELDKKLKLERVWLSGPVGSEGLNEPVDLAINQLQCFMRNVKTSIPCNTGQMMAQGWETVKLGDASSGLQSPSYPEPMDIDIPADISDVADDALKTVFHAPRGKQTDRPSKCRNRFFQYCSMVKARGDRGKLMEYRFRPTMDWYREQVEEGRGFEHIRVNTWEAIFEKHKIVEDTR